MEKTPSDSTPQDKIKAGLIENKHEELGDSSAADGNSASTSEVPDKNSMSSKPVSPSSSNRNSPDPCCAICLEKLQNKSFTNNCRHMFCFKCLVDWSKIKPVCPLCKKHFHSIIHNVQTDLQYDTYHIRTQSNDRTWNLTQTHHGMSSSIRISTTNSSEPRFRYRTTLTADRISERTQPYQIDTLQMHLENHRRRFAPHSVRVISSSQTINHMPSQERSRIYQQNLWVQALHSTRFRNASPEFFKRNPACTHRLLPWLNRELIVLLHNIESQIVFVMELIMALITRYEITSQEFFTHIEPYLFQQTSHFIHEFYNFASSPYDMETYDSFAVYEQRTEVIDDDDSNSDIIILDDPDKDADTKSKKRNSQSEKAKQKCKRQSKKKSNQVKKLVLKRNGEAGSWVPVTLPSTLNADTDITASISIPGPSTSGLISSLNDAPASPFHLISPVQVETSDEECEIVAVVKPRSERTPEIVDISSDEEIGNFIEISSNDNFSGNGVNSDIADNQSFSPINWSSPHYSPTSPSYSPVSPSYSPKTPPCMHSNSDASLSPNHNSGSLIECVFDSTKSNLENTVLQFPSTSKKSQPMDLSQKNDSSTLLKKNTGADSNGKNEGTSYSDYSLSAAICMTLKSPNSSLFSPASKFSNAPSKSFSLPSPSCSADIQSFSPDGCYNWRSPHYSPTSPSYSPKSPPCMRSNSDASLSPNHNSGSLVECVFDSRKSNLGNAVSQFAVTSSGKSQPMDLSQKNDNLTLLKENITNNSIRKDEGTLYSDISHHGVISMSSNSSESSLFTPASPNYSPSVSSINNESEDSNDQSSKSIQYSFDSFPMDTDIGQNIFFDSDDHTNSIKSYAWGLQHCRSFSSNSSILPRNLGAKNVSSCPSPYLHNTEAVIPPNKKSVTDSNISPDLRLINPTPLRNGVSEHYVPTTWNGDLITLTDISERSSPNIEQSPIFARVLHSKCSKSNEKHSTSLHSKCSKNSEKHSNWFLNQKSSSTIPCNPNTKASNSSSLFDPTSSLNQKSSSSCGSSNNLTSKLFPKDKKSPTHIPSIHYSKYIRSTIENPISSQNYRSSPIDSSTFLLNSGNSQINSIDNSIYKSIYSSVKSPSTCSLSSPIDSFSDPSIGDNTCTNPSSSTNVPISSSYSKNCQLKSIEPLQSSSDKKMVKNSSLNAQSVSPIDLSMVDSSLLFEAVLEPKITQKSTSTDTESFSLHSIVDNSSFPTLHNNASIDIKPISSPQVSEAVLKKNSPVDLSGKLHNSSDMNEKCTKQLKHKKIHSVLSKQTLDSYSSIPKLEIQSEVKRNAAPELKIEMKSVNPVSSEKSILSSKIVVPDSSVVPSNQKSSYQKVSSKSKRPVSSFNSSNSSTDSYSDSDIQTPKRKKLKLRSVVAHFSFENSDERLNHEGKRSHKSHKSKKKKKKKEHF